MPVRENGKDGGGGGQLSDHKEKWKISLSSHDEDVKRSREAPTVPPPPSLQLQTR